MPRKKQVNNRDITREQEVLNAPVHPQGKGEDPAVQALLSPDFATMSNTEALDIALVLQQIVRGQAAILNNLQTQGQELQKLRERMDKYDKAAIAWETDRKKFLEEVYQKADSVRITNPTKREEMRAKAAQRIQQEIEKAKAEKVYQDLQFVKMLESQPTEVIVSKGRVVTKREDGVIKQVVIPEVIRIRNKVWVLPPNQPVEVPKMVADEWRIRQTIQEEQEKRKKLLMVNDYYDGKPIDQVAKEWNEISSEYNAPTENVNIDV